MHTIGYVKTVLKGSSPFFKGRCPPASGRRGLLEEFNINQNLLKLGIANKKVRFLNM